MTARGIDESVRTSKRRHPLTGEPGPKVYRSGTWSCGRPAFSAACIFRRASKPGIGIYDFENDSGLRFFGGVSAPCGNSAIAALGLFIFSDSRFRCDCNPPIKTSLALAPAERNYNEDWPSGIIMDLHAWMQTYDRLRSWATSPELLFPGHDPLMTENYPEAAEGVSRLV